MPLNPFYAYLLVSWTLTAHAVASLSSKSPIGNRDGDNIRFGPGQDRHHIWQPRIEEKMQMILTGVPDISSHHLSVTPHVPIFDIDLFVSSAELIRDLHRLGKKVVCYFSAGTAEDWRPDFSNFTAADLGSPLPMWEGERYVNIRSANVLNIMKARLEMARQKECDGVDPDNIDAYANDDTIQPPLTASDAITYFDSLAHYAHEYDMAVGLKNTVEILPNVSAEVEFAVNESCVLDGVDSCTVYENFTRSGWGWERQHTTGRSSGFEGGQGDDKTRENDYAMVGRQNMEEKRWRWRRGKPVFHVEYVNHTAGSRPGEIIITTDLLPNATNLTSTQLRRQFCLLDSSQQQDQNSRATRTLRHRSLAQKLRFSTSIKTLDLDGWIMWCDGHVDETKTVLVGPSKTPLPTISASR